MFTYEQIPGALFIHDLHKMISQTVLPASRCTDALVLCVDDDSAILDIIKLSLEKNGFSVITAPNWHCALEAFKQNSIDLVILDYEMPEMKGHEVAIQIRSLNPEVPIILHSGSFDLPEIVSRVTDAFIPKGVETYILVAAISNLIMKSRAQRTHAGRHA
jgi:CheY-like chemotaxis protein